MNAPAIPRDRCPPRPTGKHVAITTLSLGVLLLAGSAFAQRQSVTGVSISEQQGLDDKSAEVVAQNIPDASTAESSSQQNQPSTALPNAPSAVKPAYLPASDLTLADRFRIYTQTVVRPYTFVGPALGAGIGQWEDSPPEWGQGAKGYGRRFASGVSRHMIAETIRFGVAAADGEDPRYHRSDDSGVWDRTKHALVETFTSETASGKRIPAYSRFAGIYGAAFIANTWYPDSHATAGWALRRGSTALASSVGFHLFEEFLPRKYFKALHLSD